MYSWNTVRSVCACLLLVPIIHLAYLVSGEALASLDASPKVWQREMDAYASKDHSARQPTDPLVVVGGQRVKLWGGLEELLAPMPVLMRGLGNATVDDIIYHHERLISFYRPHTLVLLPGNSEFHIRDAKSADELFAVIRTLASLDAEQGTSQRLYIFTPLKTPLYPGDNNKIDRVGELLKDWAKTQKHITILDANSLLCAVDGSAKPGYFRNDGVNLNEHGYLRLSIMLQTQVEKDNAARGLASTH